MKNLLKALHLAQGEMADPVRNSTNPHFRNRYADLAAVLESVADPLHRHGLVLVQLTEAGSPPKLRTQLHHAESGEMLESTIDLNAEKATPQGVMACTTYYRRLAVKAMFNLAEVDDDGNEASGVGSKPKASKSHAEIVSAMRAAKTLSELNAAADAAKSLPAGAEKEECRQVYLERKELMGAK